MSKKQRNKKRAEVEKAVLTPDQVVVPQAWEQGLGPGRPTQPTRWGMKLEPRAWDYITGMNRSTLPRLEDGSYKGVTFEELRWLSRENALVRGAIEWRKAQLMRLTYSWRPKNGDKNPDRHANTKIVRQTFERPDGVNRFKAWLAMMAEDVLVLDNNYVYPDADERPGLLTFTQLDPGTVKRYVNERGKAPRDPDVPAYAQIIKGFPSVDFAFDQLYASQRNPSTDRLYGYSPVEQVADFISLAIRRLQYQEAYYTEGNVPETMVALPEKFGPDQVAEFQRLFDDLDNLEIKRRIRMMPGGTELLTTKDAVLKDATDEWIARVICWIFQVPASALITENNRATAQTAREANMQDGLLPFMDYIKSLIDDLIEDFMGIDDVEFVWEQDESLDSRAQADVDAIYLDRGVLEVNEVRKRLGYDPIENVSMFGSEAGDEEAAARMDQALAALEADNSQDVAGNAPNGATKPGDQPVIQSTLDDKQIGSVTSILAMVTEGKLPMETASALIQAAFPGLDAALVSAMVDPLKNFKPAALDLGTETGGEA